MTEGKPSRKRKQVEEKAGNWTCQESYCGLTFQDGPSLDRHYNVHCDQELEKLRKLRVKRFREDGEDQEGQLRGNRSQVIERLRERRERRREDRLTERHINHELRVCPNCMDEVEETMNAHFDQCLRKTVLDVNDEGVDVAEDTSDDIVWEEYEWAGQTRIRSTSLYPGGLASQGFHTIQRTAESDELDVLGNDEEVGPEQFTEEDLIDSNQHQDGIIEEDDNSDEIIEDNEKKSDICKICMGQYVRPLASTVCWHVHCQTCWLRALATRKLCPQCSAIVCPGGLRRIYL